MSVERARQFRKQMSAPEARLWNALREIRPLGFHFRRQAPLGRYYADFACHRHCLVIEVDGDTHATDAAMQHDAIRDAYMRGEGYRILRVGNHEVMSNLEGVMTLILSTLEEPPPSVPPHKGEGGTPERA